MRILYIVGAGSVGGHIAMNHELYELSYDKIVFVDDNPAKIGGEFLGFDVIGPVNCLLDWDRRIDVIVGIAFPKIKEAIANTLRQNNYLKFPTLIAKNAWVSKGVRVKQGCIIYPHCSINYGSVLNEFVVMNMNCALGHHALIGNFSSLAPGVDFGGHTSIGCGVDVGIGASTIQGVSIGDYSIIGGQTIVTKSFGSDSKIVGIPGRNINSKE